PEVSGAVQLADDAIVELRKLFLVDDAEILQAVPLAAAILDLHVADREEIERFEALDEPARALGLGQEILQHADDAAHELALFAFVVEQWIAVGLRQPFVALVQADGVVRLLVDTNEDEREACDI